MSKNNAQSLPASGGRRIKRNEAEAAPTATTSDHSDTDKERRTMAVDSQYSDSACAGNPQKCDEIASLTAHELRGWWWAVVVEKVRPEHRGERAALIDRARVLRIDLPTTGGWQSIGEIAGRMVRGNG